MRWFLQTLLQTLVFDDYRFGANTIHIRCLVSPTARLGHHMDIHGLGCFGGYLSNSCPMGPRKKWAVDLSTFQWQSAPIAAGAMLMGWTTYTEDLTQESNAILLAVGGVFILFSSITLAESFHPERRKEHRDYDKKGQSKRICLFFQIFLIQGVLAFLLGLLVASLL